MLADTVKDLIFLLVTILFISGREHIFRAWISNLGPRLVRRSYVKLLISGVDGYSQAVPAMNTIIAIGATVVVIFAALYFPLVTALTLQRAPLVIKPLSEIGTSDESKANLEKLESSERVLKIAYPVTFAFLLGWMTQVHFRTRIMFLLAQAVRRLSAVATKAEMKPLLSAESKVTDDAGQDNELPNPVLQYLLPSLLLVKMMAIVDEALEFYLDQNGVTLTKPYRDDLNGRISYLGDNGKLIDAAGLHDLRKGRNLVAHDATEHASWKQLDDGIAKVHAELQHLGYVGPMRKYEFYWVQEAAKDSPDPNIIYTQDFRYGVKVDGKEAMEIKWTESMPADQS